MKPLIVMLTLIFSTVLATGCNTMEGLGKDVEKGGEKIQKEADR